MCLCVSVCVCGASSINRNAEQLERDVDSDGESKHTRITRQKANAHKINTKYALYMYKNNHKK